MPSTLGVVPVALVAATVLMAATAPAPAGAQGLALDTVELTNGLVLPVDVADPGDGSGRLFLVQQGGLIRVWNGTSIETTPFLDLSGQVTCCGEQGLLGLVFHPDYAVNGEFFVNYTHNDGGQLETVVARFEVSGGDPDVANPAEDVLLRFDQPAGNHNAGDLAFGPDGYLYIPTGDGGGAGDPNENGQDLAELLGKVLRIDVDSSPDPGLAYAIPADNPFVGQAAARAEIWAYGLRNPFRFSFDRSTGDLWIGDVGQNAWEEVDRQPASSEGGENYGWDCREGAHDYTGTDNDGLAGCAGLTFTDPVLEYAHAGGRCSVTGGFRYRGDAEPRLRGVYLFADFCTGEIFGTVPRCDGAWESQLLLDAPFNITTFGEDSGGELYVSQYIGGSPAPATSRIHQLVLAAGSGGPDLLPSPAPLDFGTVEVGDTVSLLLTLENDNLGPEAAATASRVFSDPARFSLDFKTGPASCPSGIGGFPCLSPGASCTMAVRLKATAAGPISETLTFDGNFVQEVVTLEADAVPCSSDVNLTVSNLTVANGQSETRRACDTLTAAPDVVVETGGDLTLRAGTRIILGDGFQVESGGSLVLEIF
jgi:glucose/arabinose dehydrogenase